jgi:hypothetical protein
MGDKVLIEEKMQKLIEMTAGFCDIWTKSTSTCARSSYERCPVSGMSHSFPVGLKSGRSAFFAFVGEKNLLKKTSQLTRKER